VNYLGRGWQSCLLGLRDYHRRILRTRICAGNGTDAWLAREQLQHLLFDIEVDVAVRSGTAGAQRMTQVEKAIFHSTVVRLGATFRNVGIDSAPFTWLDPLNQALAIVHAAVRSLREWRRPAHRPMLEVRAQP
jgi:hypothetical protein